jgi:hypothetical protein
MFPAPATCLRSYVIRSPIGAGMAEVHRARDTKLGHDVALKILLEGFSLRMPANQNARSALAVFFGKTLNRHIR